MNIWFVKRGGSVEYLDDVHGLEIFWEAVFLVANIYTREVEKWWLADAPFEKAGELRNFAGCMCLLFFFCSSSFSLAS